MRVCVVGGTGNISTSIVRLLLEVGHEVTLFNRGKRGTVPAGVKVIHGDLKERAAFEAAMQAQRFDAAIHMICYGADDARSALRAFRDVKHLVYCSTVCAYGVQYDWLPVTEDHPLRPITDYGRNKAAADRIYMEAYNGQGFPVTIIRPSSTFGPTWFLLRQIAWEAALGGPRAQGQAHRPLRRRPRAASVAVRGRRGAGVRLPHRPRPMRRPDLQYDEERVRHLGRVSPHGDEGDRPRGGDGRRAARNDRGGEGAEQRNLPGESSLTT